MISSTSQKGGGPTNIFLLSKNLNRNRFNIFFAMPDSKYFKSEIDKNIYINISERTIKIKDLINLKKFIKKNSIDIIHSHGKGASFLGRIVSFISRKPLIYTYHGIHLKCHNFFKRFLYIAFENLTGFIDARKVYVSNSEQKYANKKFFYNNSCIINNGVNNKSRLEYRKISKKDKIKIPTIITICRFVKQKNIKEILKIAENLKHYKFVILGDGPLFKEIKNIIKTKKINNVILPGMIDDVFYYLYNSDVYLSTSLYEGLPISILEAMSIGLPIVATNVIGNSDTIENFKSGYLYDLGDYLNGVHYIKTLVENEDIKEKIGKQAFIRQRKLFSIELMLKKYEYLYIQVHKNSYNFVS